MQLRPYQQQCITDCINWIKSTTSSGVVDATVSFGKSIVIAELSKRILELSGKRVLVLCPNGTLTEQNSDEMKGLGIKHSIFSASLKKTSLEHKIVIGTPLTIKNHLAKFGASFGCILIDEGDGITKSIKEIIAKIKEANPVVRVIGFTGTPYRLGEGYIYQIGLDGNPVPESEARDPYYVKLIHRTSTQHLMDEGYLTPLKIGEIGADSYDTSALIPNRFGKFDKHAVDQAYHGHGRKTATIVADIINRSRGRAGVLIYAATIKHADEVMASLPPALSRIVHGGMGQEHNDKAIKDFKAKKFKYLVNVDMLTVGANFPHCDTIAVLRKTDSARLLQQIIGRILRLSKENPAPLIDDAYHRKLAISQGPKPYSLYLDYTSDNFDTHFPDGDIFNPVIKASYKGGESFDIEADCALCGTTNTFKGRDNKEGFEVDKYGYFIDGAGDRIKIDGDKDYPAHYGRRCLGMVKNGAVYEQCNGRWTFKTCEACDHENDIAARYCKQCKHELIDPNEKLVKEFKKFKKDPTQLQTDEVLDWVVAPSITRSGNNALIVSVTTPYRKFSVWLHPHIRGGKPYAEYEQCREATNDFKEPPKTVTYRRNTDNKFYSFHGFNRPIDEIPSVN